ncbi:DUF1453 domain-containing protein [Kitasatospora sp. NPDC127121]|uniref:DUF1453 domain-containing protein n=1 Tax=Kitasatospora sp. NPDC127121 TaxID=3345371 RepID=UPI003642D1ED
MNVWLQAGLIAVVVVVVVIRRLRGEPLNARDLFAPPVVLTAIGFWSLVRHPGLGAGDYAWVAAGAALGVGLGVLRGITVTLFERDGVAWQRYTGRTFLVAAGSLAVMAGFGLLAGRFGLAPDARPVQLSIGVGFLGEALAVGCRVLVAGLPFAPERRGLNPPLGADRIRR